MERKGMRKWTKIMAISVLSVLFLSFLLPLIMVIVHNKNIDGKNNSDIYRPLILQDRMTVINITGYCYNPDHPELGPSYQNIVYDLEKELNCRIYSLNELYGRFYFKDDHCGSLSPKDTGDVFNFDFYFINKSSGEKFHNMPLTSFPGGTLYTYWNNLSAVGGGRDYDNNYYIDINITNCGEYPKYLKNGPGFFSEPDPGNDWFLEIKLFYTVILR